MGEMEYVMYGLGYGHVTPTKDLDSTTLPKSDNTCLGDDDDHQGEIRKKV
jgi:hypothetical protein